MKHQFTAEIICGAGVVEVTLYVDYTILPGYAETNETPEEPVCVEFGRIFEYRDNEYVVSPLDGYFDEEMLDDVEEEIRLSHAEV